METRTRQSRMEKYYDSSLETKEGSSRTKRNKELYKEVSNLELEDFDLNSNVSVLSNNTSNINLDEVKDILNKKYHEEPRKKSFGDTLELDLPPIDLDETREYDINAILAKAKEQKEINYEEERLKKVNDSQYDILKHLDSLNDDEEVSEEVLEKPTDRRPAPENKEQEEKLMDLIDTATAEELLEEEQAATISGEMDPLDLLSDLRGDDEETKVMGMMETPVLDDDDDDDDEDDEPISLDDIEKVKEELSKEKSDTSQITPIPEDTIKIEPEDEDTDKITPIFENTDTEENYLVVEDSGMTLEDEDSKEDEDTLGIQITNESTDESFDTKAHRKISLEDKEELGLDNSFIGNTTTFDESDFDDFKDLKDDVGFTKIMIRVLIILIVLVFVAGVVILANKYLNLGLF